MRAAVVVMLWIPAVLWLDRTASSSAQTLLGVLTWALLIVLLWRESPLLRAQTLVVIVFATTVEYVFSAWLGIYDYRLDQVPAYVPPGHGLVYLAAAGMGLALASRPSLARLAVAATVVAGAVLAVWGLWRSNDVLGAFWYLCLVGFLAWGRNRLLYVGAFVAVTWLEFLGTTWGVWTWKPRDTILGIVSIGNPPSVAAGGYGWFDLAAVAAAPALLMVWARLRGKQRDHVLVQNAVGAEPACDSTATVSGGAIVGGDFAARFAHDRDESCDVPRVELGLGSDVDGALGHKQVRPEVAVGSHSPAPTE